MKTFPMFLRMEGREVVIAGGGEQAAQKARLMLKTEARLRLVAAEIDDELADLVAQGRVAHDTAPVTPGSFAGTALVFIATGCPGLDAALHALAKAGGAVVNVVDRPDLCDAVTPSIVDRDPVVVAIGTEGNAPVLARLLKTRVEEMLPPRLGDFASLAGRLREAVARHVPRAKRRDFWRWMFQGAPAQLHARGNEREAAGLLKQAIAEGGAPDTPAVGAISLVGAGPGSADLLTLRAVRRLQEADIIFVDPEVDPAVLELARRDAERVRIASAGDGAGWPADRLAGRLAAEARRGAAVVHLVGGTPQHGALDRLAPLAGAAMLEIVPGAQDPAPPAADTSATAGGR